MVTIEPLNRYETASAITVEQRGGSVSRRLARLPVSGRYLPHEHGGEEPAGKIIPVPEQCWATSRCLANDLSRALIVARRTDVCVM